MHRLRLPHWNNRWEVKIFSMVINQSDLYFSASHIKKHWIFIGWILKVHLMRYKVKEFLSVFLTAFSSFALLKNFHEHILITDCIIAFTASTFYVVYLMWRPLRYEHDSLHCAMQYNAIRFNDLSGQKNLYRVKICLLFLTLLLSTLFLAISIVWSKLMCDWLNLEWICMYYTHCFNACQTELKQSNEFKANKRKRMEYKIALHFIVYRLADWHLDNKLCIWSKWRRVRIYQKLRIVILQQLITNSVDVSWLNWINGCLLLPIMAICWNTFSPCAHCVRKIFE